MKCKFCNQKMDHHLSDYDLVGELWFPFFTRHIDVCTNHGDIIVLHHNENVEAWVIADREYAVTTMKDNFRNNFYVDNRHEEDGFRQIIELFDVTIHISPENFKEKILTFINFS